MVCRYLCPALRARVVLPDCLRFLRVLDLTTQSAKVLPFPFCVLTGPHERHHKPQRDVCVTGAPCCTGGLCLQPSRPRRGGPG